MQSLQYDFAQSEYRIQIQLLAFDRDPDLLLSDSDAANSNLLVARKITGSGFRRVFDTDSIRS